MTTALRFPLSWDPTYETGHPVIDTQHHRLLELANLLHQAVVSGHGADIRAQAFQALLLYTHEHFEDEETVFAECGCTQIAEHKEHHAGLAVQLQQLAEDDALGFTADMDAKLESWVIHHLMPHMTADDQAAWAACPHKDAVGAAA